MRGSTTRFITILGILVAAAGCGGGGGTMAYSGPTVDIHCTTTRQGLLICYEGLGVPTSSTSTFESSCGGAKVEMGECDPAGAIGGCRLEGMIMNAPVEETTWVFSGTTAAALMKSCTDSKGTYLAP